MMFRFTIRELLILTVTAGLAVGWWLDRTRLAERVSFLEWKKAEIITLEGAISYDTLTRVMQEDERQRQRFASQSARP